jgi:hypothetical protein
MDAPPLPHRVRRGAHHRGVCLALGALCLLAVLAGSIARVGEPAHHRSNAFAAATISFDPQAAGTRTILDAALADRTTSQTSNLRWAAALVTRPPHERRGLDAVRTRGPPATA